MSYIETLTPEGYTLFTFEGKVQNHIDLKATQSGTSFLQVVDQGLKNTVILSAFFDATGLRADPVLFRIALIDLIRDNNAKIDPIIEQFMCFVHSNTWSKIAETLERLAKNN